MEQTLGTRARRWSLLAAAGALVLGAVACTGPRPPRTTTTTTTKPGACHGTEFEEASVDARSTTTGTRYVLTVVGTLADSRYQARLRAATYIQQPDYWLIDVLACQVADVGTPARTPFKVSIDVTDTLGTEGIEVRGVTTHQRFDVPARPAPPLANTGWVLDPASLGVPAPGRPITLNFGATNVSGNSGCNAFGADYTATGSSAAGTFRLVGPIRSTAMACIPDVSAAESTYLRKLSAADSYRIADSMLTLSGPQGSLVFGTPPPTRP